MARNKITLLAEHCWVIRSAGFPKPKGPPKFWCASNAWDGSPAHCTIFHSEEDAQRQIEDGRYHRRVGFELESQLEAVPLDGALRTLGIGIKIVKGGDREEPV